MVLEASRDLSLLDLSCAFLVPFLYMYNIPPRRKRVLDSRFGASPDSFAETSALLNPRLQNAETEPEAIEPE